MVWRAFHASLEHYSLQSPTLVKELLTSNIGLGDAAAESLMTLGHQYLQEIERLDFDARAEISRR